MIELITIEDEDEVSENGIMPIKSKASSTEKGTAATCNRKGIVSTGGNVKRKRSWKKDDLKDILNKAKEESINNDAYIKVHDIIPNYASYVVTHCESIDENKWCATIRATIDNESDAKIWLSKFQNENSLDFRFRKSVNVEDSKKLVFKRQYRCHHNTMPKKNNAASNEKSRNFKSKNTDCPAYVRITIKQKTMNRSSDAFLQTYPCEIVIRHTHNHPIVGADALRRRRPSEVIHAKFSNLLQEGYSPLAALVCHKFDLQIEHGEDYPKVLIDQALCPRNTWVYKLFNKLCIKQIGPQTGEEMFESLERYCDDYNMECQTECAKVEVVDGEHIVVAICTPLMKRASRLLESAAEILFADSSGPIDCLNSKLFLLQTSSVAGVIPLGALIVTSESERVLNVAFASWKSLLPEDAFYGRGANVGPKLIITGDCACERNALQRAFSDSVLLLCLFHILQAFWRFIWNRKQNVLKEDIGEVFSLFRDIAYAENEESFYKNLEYAGNSDKLKKYPRVLEHVEKLVLRASEWALCYRKNLLTRGNDTNSYSEAGIRTFKDKVRRHSKAFNTVQIFEFLVTRYDIYLKGKIIDVVNNRASNAFKFRYYVCPEKLQDLICKKLESPPSTFLVRNTSKETENSVVMDLEICSCLAGQSGAPCKHMSAVVQEFKLTSSLVHPLLQCHDTSMANVLFEVANEPQNVSIDFFSDLHDFCHYEEPEDACVTSVSNATILIDTTVSNLEPERNDENSETEFSEEFFCSLENSLDVIFSQYKQNVREKPEAFVDAVKAFISQNEKLCHSEAELLSALHTFGKQSETLPTGCNNKRIGSTIPEQPTSKARRTVFVVGKQAQFTEGPHKIANSLSILDLEHNYGKPNEENQSGTTVQKSEGVCPSFSYSLCHK